MRIYLDVSCLNRPFDDQSQTRVRAETDAVLFVLERAERGDWQQIASEMAGMELKAIRDRKRRARVRALLREAEVFVKLNTTIYARAAAIEKLGFKPGDALHVAAAEAGKADVLLSCDDQMCKAGKRSQEQLSVRIVNPVFWLKETGHDIDA